MVNWKLFWQKESFEGPCENYKDKKYKELHLSLAKDIEQIIIQYNYRTILDVGCGPAIIIKTLAKKYPNKEFTGSDISSYIINLNKKCKFKNLHFEIKDFNDIQKEKKFDLVFSFSTLHYVTNPLKKIKELLMLVNDGGSLIINYPNKKLLMIHKNGGDLKYWSNRFKLMFQEKNLITLSQIKKLGHKCKIIREKRPENKYIQIFKREN